MGNLRVRFVVRRLVASTKLHVICGQCTASPASTSATSVRSVSRRNHTSTRTSSRHTRKKGRQFVPYVAHYFPPCQKSGGITDASTSKKKLTIVPTVPTHSSNSATYVDTAFVHMMVVWRRRKCSKSNDRTENNNDNNIRTENNNNNSIPQFLLTYSWVLR